MFVPVSYLHNLVKIFPLFPPEILLYLLFFVNVLYLDYTSCIESNLRIHMP